jgi:hypothetical protein
MYFFTKCIFYKMYFFTKCIFLQNVFFYKINFYTNFLLQNVIFTDICWLRLDFESFNIRAFEPTTGECLDAFIVSVNNYTKHYMKLHGYMFYII